MAKPSVAAHGAAILGLLLAAAAAAAAPVRGDGDEGGGPYLPVGAAEYRPFGEGLQMGEPFQTCGDCTCCWQGNQNDCIAARCCYRINCNIPGKPFGTCGFTPVSCDCNGCS